MQDGNSDDFFKRTCHGFCVNKRPRGIRYNYSFDRPPVAPTFYPTKEEFEDPTLYINNIRPLAEQYGLCKVVPPKDTFFPFTLDVANFKFPTRVQNLCRIDAAAKNKAIFLGRLKKFWEMRGKALKAPILDYQVLDLHYLHRTVMSEGGYAKVKRQNKWHTVSERMAYGNDSQIPARLEKYYEELLLPYVTLLEEENKGTDTASKPPPTQMSASDTMKAAEEETEMEEFAKSDSIYQLHRAKRMKLSQMEPIASTSRCSEEPETCDQSKIGELEKLYSVAIGEQSNVLESSKPETEISAKNLFKTPDLIIPKIVVTETTERGSKQPEKERASKPPEKASGSTQPEQESGPKPPEQASGSKQPEQESGPKPPEQASGSKQPEQESGPKPPEQASGSKQPEQESGPKPPEQASGSKQPEQESGPKPPEQASGSKQPEQERGPKQPEQESGPKPPEQASGSKQPEQESGPKPPEQASGSKQPEQESGPKPPEQASGSKQPEQESGPKPPEQASGSKQPEQESGPKTPEKASGSKQAEQESDPNPPEQASGSKQTEQESGPKPPEQASGSKQAEQESDHNPPEQASSSKQPDQESGPKPPEHVFKVPYPVSETRHGVTPRKSNELKRLQFHGAGPRIAVFTEPKSGKCGKRKRLKECCKCWKTNKLIDEILLDCYRCGDSYHLTCIVPKLNEIPRGNWHCNECIIKKLKTIPVEGLKAGFEDGKRLYTLAQFQKKADSFKEMYFDGQGKISKMRLENEFWYILSNDVEETVEYGADISGDNGTGFPTKECLKNVRPEFRERYKKLIDHPWNLNNLPVCDSSVLQFIDEPISGMKVPWMYIGMMFSTFCWHNEDHWCYSINFLHFGETKTWYSVPGDYAEEFENVVKEFAPELFEVHPDILHQLVTMINPNVLMERKIPVYRLDQEAGEFVITFPRAYHCGFNHGFNFAEAVNFAPPDWIAIGRRCVENYALSKRACVFSQDELIFKIAARYAAIDVRTCSAAYHDLYRAVHAEFAFREFFTSEWGGDNKECVVDFEFIPDDERQCEFCKTTVFMSGVSCQCDPIKVVCIRHYNKLCTVCKPKDHYLKIKHSAEHIFHIFQEMLKVVSPYEKWVRDVRNILRNNVPLEDGSTSFIGIDYLKDLVKVADRNNYPSTNLLKELIASVAEAEAINNTADRILSRIGSQQRPGEDIEDENDEDRPSFTELMNFIQSIDTKHLVYLKDDGILKYIRDVFEWKDRVKAVIASKCSDSKEMETLKKEGVRFNLDLPEIESLEGYIVRLKWREELADLFERHNELTKEILQEHKDKGLALNFEKDPEIEEGIIKIDELIDQINAWEEEAKNLIVVSRTKPTPESLRLLLDQGEEIKARLPSRKILENVLQSGLKWVDKVIAANSLKNGPYVDVYEDLLTQAHKINLELLLTDQILIQLDLVRIWREKVAATFLKSNGLTLMEALAPRNEILRSSKRKRDNYLSKNIIYGVKLSGDTDPGVVVAAFKRAEKLEFEQMLQLRLENSRKKIDSDAKYCICRKSEAGFMVECNLCKEKFHGPCLQMGIESDMAGSELADTKFLCSTCVRTKRPKLDILVELVQSMHMIKVRIPEGEALQRLTERAMNWQDRARKLLGTPEMTLALQKLYVPLPNIPRPTPRLQHPVNYERTPSSTVTSGMLAQASTSTSSSISHFAIDHGYSTVSRKTIPPKKHMRKSPLIPRVLEEPPRMSEAGFTQLKELMIQGDLMEVFVEEATCIWKLLQTFKQLYYSIWDEGYEDFVRHEAEKAKQEAAELKIEKGLSAIERFFQDKPPPPGSKKRTVNETPAPAKKTAKAPRKTSAKKTIATKPTKSKKPEPKQPKKKQKTSNATVRPAKRAKKSKQVDDDDDENDENSCEDDCAAEPCRRPTGTALHWVQCDGGCDLWFHLYCIGLNKEEIVADQDYVCEKCS